MQMIGSIVREQGVTFAIVLVEKRVVDNPSEADRMVESLIPVFGGMSIVLAAQDSTGGFIYRGRDDLSKFLASIDPTRIPWKKYTLS